MAQGFGNTSGGGVTDIIAASEVPRSLTGRADHVISGGQFVTVGPTANVVGSVASLFVPGGIVFRLIVDPDFAVGIALQNVGSNETLSVATRGLYIVRAAETISGGQGVYPFSGTGVDEQAVRNVPIGASDYSGTQVGRAITTATSGTNQFVLVNFSF